MTEIKVRLDKLDGKIDAGHKELLVEIKAVDEKFTEKFDKLTDSIGALKVSTLLLIGTVAFAALGVLGHAMRWL